MRQRVATIRVEPQRLGTGGFKRRLGLRIAAREQGNLMSLANQFLGQIRHHALGAAVKLRRTAFV